MNQADEGTLRLATPEERLAKAEEMLGKLQAEVYDKNIKIHRINAQLDVYKDFVNDLIAALRGDR